MTKPQSRARLAQMAGALLVIAVLMSACVAAPAPTGTPLATTAPAAGTAAPAATQAAVQPTIATGPSAPLATAELGSQEAGASASLNPAAKFVTHYKGDPNAKVVIIEVSDFQ